MVNVRHRLGLHSTLLLDRSLSGHTEKQFNEVIQINEKKPTRFEWFLLIYNFPSMMLQVFWAAASWLLIQKSTSTVMDNIHSSSLWDKQG